MNTTMSVQTEDWRHVGRSWKRILAVSLFLWLFIRTAWLGTAVLTGSETELWDSLLQFGPRQIGLFALCSITAALFVLLHRIREVSTSGEAVQAVVLIGVLGAAASVGINMDQEVAVTLTRAGTVLVGILVASIGLFAMGDKAYGGPVEH